MPAAIAGWEVLRIINEPTAAALRLRQWRKKGTGTIAVYDSAAAPLRIRP